MYALFGRAGSDKVGILICGLSCDFNKFAVQVNLIKNLKNDLISSKAITYNPTGLLYKFDIFQYPTKIIFPDIVCSANNHLFYTEFFNTPDVWVIDVAGGCFFISNQNKNNFGKLSEVYLQAANVDMIVLCIDCFINTKTINSFLHQLQKYGVKKVFFVLIKNAIDQNFIETTDSIQTYYVDKKVYKYNFDRLQKILEDKLFSLEDVENNKLYEAIAASFVEHT
jgi:hypothetical protein